MAQLISVKLSRFDGSPWGFRLQGGKDFGTPLIVQKVNGGSPAEQAGLRAGDAVIRVNTTDMFNLRHKDAQDVIVRSGNSFEITVQRGGSTWRPSVSPVTPSIPSPQPNAPASCISPVTKTSLAAKKQDAPLIGSGHNFTPKPFLNGSSEGPIKSIVNKQYNSPVGIYSEETIAETLSAQAEVLAGGVLGVNFKKNEKNYNAQNSEVFKMVQEADKEPRSPEPAEPVPNSGVISPPSPAIAGLRSVSAPETKPQPTTPQGSLPPGQNICADCERLIVGVFVRIKEKNLHVECFKCSTCGTSLKNVGYYNINNKLYCDIHAKLVARQQAPSGLTPITIPPGGKAPAGTISAALANLGGGAPLSPSLNSHGSPQPFSARNNRRSSGDLGVPQRRPSRTDLPSYYAPINGHDAPTNGTIIYDERDSYTEQDSCNAKTYTSTITIRTGNEVGRLNDRVNELYLDDNRNPTNKLYVSRQSDVTKRDNNTIKSSSSSPPLKITTNGDDVSRFIVFEKIGNKKDTDLLNGSNDIVSRNREQEPAVVNTCGFPRYQVTNQRLKTGSFSSYHPSNANLTTTTSSHTEQDDRTSEPHSNGKEPDYSNAIHGNRGYQSVTQRLLTSYGSSLASPSDRLEDNVTQRVTDSPKFEYVEQNVRKPEGLNKNNCISGFRSMNGRSDSLTSAFTNYRSLPESFSSGGKNIPTAPPPPPEPTILSTSLMSSTRPNRLGTPPVDTPSFRPVQSHTSNNISGPKPFGGSSVVAPSSFVAAPVINSGSNTLPRPQSQTVTGRFSTLPTANTRPFRERYYQEDDYYESIEAPVEEEPPRTCYEQQQQLQQQQLQQQQLQNQQSHSSVKNKSLVWPPVKPIEDITYPTASPIWIDPNPVLDKRPRHNVREKRTTLQEAADSRCGSRCGSRCCSRYEEREYERYSSSSRVNNRESSMDRASCSQPFYRKVEMSETRRECRAPVYTPRPSSVDGVRRSLTPTRISQPVPRPWMATVTSGTSVYGHVEPPPQPEPERVCRQVCRCQIICERTSGPQGPEHEQQHTYREVSCELCRPPAPPQPICCKCPEPQEPEPEVCRETDTEVVDLSKVVPPDVAICPKGVDNQHNLFTETMEKDVGDIHIKKTTIYEKTVELLSPERARSPEPEEQAAPLQDEPCQITCEEETFQRSSATLDREVEHISDRRTTVESTEMLSSAIDTAQMMENAKKEEEAKRREYEKICREEEERLRRQEAECEEQQRRYEEERARRHQKKHVAFSGTQKTHVIKESCKPEECYSREEYVEKICEPEPSEERYRELTEEIKIQENFQQLEEERRQSLREQVEVHQCIREQQAPEKRQSLQERRLCARFRDTPAEREERMAQQQSQQSQSQETCQRKHVQFVAQSETTTKPLPPSNIKNATAKEWKTGMVQALTTAPERPYSPFDVPSSQHQEDSETTSRTIYSTEVRYEETCKPCPRPAPQPYPPERPVSPFQSALITAPDRPYTPLGRDDGEGYDSVICVDRCQTPVDSVTREGYCHPAEILYTDDKTREARSRERNLRKVEGPQPLPIPPQDHRLRDSSASPARSLSRPGTPKDRSLMTGLKKPGTIPSYQRYLVSMQHDAVESQPYVPSRSPTPNRCKSPAQGPPEPPSCFRAQAPRIRDSPPPCKRTTGPPCQQAPPPEHRECVSYHMEEDTPSGHRAQAYHGMRRSYYSDDSRCDEVQNVCKSQRVDEYERSDEKSSIAVQRQDEHDDTPGCGIGKVNRVQPSLACPLAHCSGSERFPKTGVRVLPPCPPPAASQSYETRRYVHEQRTCSSSSAFASQQQGQGGECPNSGVTIMPCKTTSGSGTKAGIVIMPCEGSDNTSCSRAGICVTPTPDRSGVCVSPVAHGKSATNCAKPSGGPRSGGCTIDIGNCPASGVRVAACGDGSVCVAPCSIPGYAPVQCPKPILKSPGLPYPQIPLPCDPQEPPNPCDSCPLKSQSACQQQVSATSVSCTTNNQSFQPIREPRTNLSNQLTRLTVKRDKQHVVQLFKPQAQCQSSSQCLITDTQCQTTTQYRGPQNPGPNCNTRKTADPPNLSSQPDLGSGIGGPGAGGRSGKFAGSTAPKRGRGILNQAGGPGSRQPLCGHCNSHVRGPFITALGQIWCPDHFVCVNSQCRRALQDIGFVEEKGQLHCEYCFERFIAPACNKCNSKIKGDCLNAVGKHFHPECFNCSYCGKLFGNSPFFLEEGLPYCEADWNELFTTKCYACGFPVEAGDRWVEALNNNYHSQCFNCTMCKKNLEGQSFYAKGGRPFCKNHAR